MKLHFEIFDQERIQVFKKLKFFSQEGFLAGGTALALQIGHRLSYDFDLFCRAKINESLVLKAKKVFSIKKVLINNQDEFTFLVDRGIKISFIYYPFNLNEYLLEDGLPIKILSVQGVALTKAYTLNRRNSWRDYLDLYFILSKKIITLKEIIKQAKKVYSEMFSEKLFLSQLVYTDDIAKSEIEGLKVLTKKITLNQVKHFFQKEIDDYLKGSLSV